MLATSSRVAALGGGLGGPGGLGRLAGLGQGGLEGWGPGGLGSWGRGSLEG